jgi:hypothetical protein
MITPLWAPKHPYYCSEGCYFSRECHTNWPTWSAFFAEMGDADVDMNLVWRWDFMPEGVDDGNEPPADWTTATLRLFVMGQRKAKPHSHFVTVRREDEPAIRVFLQQHWETIQKLWAPFTADSGPLVEEVVAQMRAHRLAVLRAEIAELEATTPGAT